MKYRSRYAVELHFTAILRSMNVYGVIALMKKNAIINLVLPVNLSFTQAFGASPVKIPLRLLATPMLRQACHRALRDRIYNKLKFTVHNGGELVPLHNETQTTETMKMEAYETTPIQTEKRDPG
jgi:hypothetical protein